MRQDTICTIFRTNIFIHHFSITIYTIFRTNIFIHPFNITICAIFHTKQQDHLKSSYVCTKNRTKSSLFTKSNQTGCIIDKSLPFEPKLNRPFLNTLRCFETAGNDISKGLAIGENEATTIYTWRLVEPERGLFSSPYLLFAQGQVNSRALMVGLQFDHFV